MNDSRRAPVLETGNRQQRHTHPGQATGQSLSITRQKGGPIILLSFYHATWQERPHLL